MQLDLMPLKNSYNVKFYVVFVLSQLLCIMFYHNKKITMNIYAD